jgi:hypothetical protein
VINEDDDSICGGGLRWGLYGEPSNEEEDMELELEESDEEGLKAYEWLSKTLRENLRRSVCTICRCSCKKGRHQEKTAPN